jgi:hypothetical protein
VFDESPKHPVGQSLAIHEVAGADGRGRTPSAFGRSRLLARLALLPCLVGLAVGLAACGGSDSPVSPDGVPLLSSTGPWTGSGAGHGPPFLRCDPQPHASEARVIGPDGGQLNIGPHRLVVPAGALTEATTIRGEAPPSEIAHVVLQPHGLEFLIPATLTLDHRHCRRPGRPTEQIVYFNEHLNILEWLPTTRTGFRSHAPLRHFSMYGMSSGRAALSD